MSNSSLSCMRKISPMQSGRKSHAVTRITPHCVVGQTSVEWLCEFFYSSGKEASCNYGIGVDGRIGTIVDEIDHSWCTSNWDNDDRAVTIECASDTFHPYAVNANVWKSLVNLCADICQRNGKKKLLWLGSKDKTLSYNPKTDEMVLTAHRWFDNKSCPGDYIYNRLGQLAKEVNQKLGGEPAGPFKAYQGQVNADDGLNCRTSPISGNVLKTYPDGTVVIISKEDGNWGYTGEGWVCLDYINKIASAKDPATKEEEIMDGKQFNKLFNEMRQQWRDNDASKYSEAARKWSVDNGLIAGGSSKEFNGMWEDLMTREQLVMVLYRFAQWIGKV
ncbi:N-acetylmuramoyl-L-alanine amidase [Acutalibacter sp.]|uniref:N-acetylmuramoyl-L-alanine amidase n=1 Tax=Acutalibacter sp. TaxID=1918636 RepID=UPI0021729E61|nr:N-acetylmuramoyl-L-alanine amidase [Acutalibacter sp.]